DTDKAAPVAYTVPTGAREVPVKDLAANLLGATSLNAVDGAGPALVGGTVYDTNADGRIDQADFTFSEDVVSDTVAANASKFLVDKDAAQTPATNAHVVNTDPKTVNVSIDGGIDGTEAKDLATSVGAVKDALNNPSSAVTLLAAAVSDKASPVALSVTPTGQNTNAAVMTLTFSEPMDTSASPTVTYGQDSLNGYNDKAIAAIADSDHTNGYQNTDATKWQGNATTPDGVCSVPTGCENHISISNAKGATSPDPMTTDTHLTWTVDTEAPDVPAITSPTQNQTLITSLDTLNATISGTSNEAGLTVNVFEGDSTPKATAITGSNGAWSVNVADLGLGSHTVTVSATDAGGNVSPVSAGRTFVIKQLPTLTIARSASSVNYGSTVRLSGTLKAGGAALASKRVTIQQLPYGTSSWSNLYTVTTNSSGAYAYNAKIVKRTQYRAVFGGEATLASVTSSATTVLAKVIVSISQSASSITYGRYVTFSGYVSPNQYGKRAYLQIKNSNGTWSNLTYRYLDSKSHYAISYKPTARGTRYYRVYVPYTTSYYVGNYSASKYVKVS
ncbi:MAG: Ig-like domain-containing protein, partial [Actinobacteria bacterium]|nr:Ig-like domain-containing protein [Actinomycetota bacterium]